MQFLQTRVVRLLRTNAIFLASGFRKNAWLVFHERARPFNRLIPFAASRSDANENDGIGVR
jgi:hypothetical protein